MTEQFLSIVSVSCDISTALFLSWQEARLSLNRGVRRERPSHLLAMPLLLQGTQTTIDVSRRCVLPATPCKRLYHSNSCCDHLNWPKTRGLNAIFAFSSSEGGDHGFDTRHYCHTTACLRPLHAPSTHPSSLLATPQNFAHDAAAVVRSIAAACCGKVLIIITEQAVCERSRFSCK